MNYRKSEAKEAARAQFRGVWAAIPTPFTPDLQVDEAGLRHNMRHLTGNLKIEGVFCTGVMGEFWSLTKEERKRCVEIVVEEAKRGGCKVIAHTAHHSAHETVELTLHAQNVGADFVILMNQYYPPASDQTMYEWFKFVADRVDIGLWMFDAEYSGFGMSPEVTARIAEIPNVCGIKLPRPIEHYRKVHPLLYGKIVISEPSESLWLNNMREFGQKVFQSSPAPYLMQTTNWLPMREYTELGLNGKFPEAEKIAATMQPLRELMGKWMRAPWVERKLIPIANIKAWCEMLGMAGGPVRPGLPQITEKERQELCADLERTGILGRVQLAKAA